MKIDQRLLAGCAVVSAGLSAASALAWAPLGWLAAAAMLAVAMGLAGTRWRKAETEPAEQFSLGEEELRQLQLAGARTPCFIWHATATETQHADADLESAPWGRYQWRIRFVYGDPVGMLSLQALANEPAEKVWGRARHPDDRVRCGHNFAQAVRNGDRQMRQEFRLIDAMGQTRWIEELLVIQPTGQGSWRVAGACVDITEQKKVEEVLKAERMQLRALIDSVPDHLYIKDAEGRFVLANKSTAQDMGVDDPQTLLGHSDADYFPAGKAERFRAEEQRLLSDGVSIIGNDHPVEVGGVTRWFTSNKFALRNESGAIVGLVGVGHDMTERKLAEDAVSQSEARLRQLMQHARCLIFEADVQAPEGWREQKRPGCFDWRISTVADATAALNLIDLDCAGGHEFFGAFVAARDPSDVARMDATFLEVVLEGWPSYSQEYRAKNRHGQWQWFSETTYLTAIGPNRWRAAATVTDVTDLRRAEDALAAEQRLLRAFISATPDNIYFKDRQSRFILVNESLARNVGQRKPQDMIGRTDFDFFGAHAREAFQDEQQIMATGVAIVDKEEREDRPDGLVTWTLSTKMPLRDQAGEIIGIMGISRDITARRRAEEEVRQFNTQLEQRVKERTSALEASNRELEAFGYSVSHDLRAPLRHIDGYVQLLARCREGLSEKDRHYLDTIADSARQMGRLIDDLLQFSRMGRTEMRQAEVDMDRLVQEAVAAARQSASARSIEWIVGSLRPVRGDCAMLRLVWTNLLNNAVKYTQPRPHSRIEIGMREEGGELVFFVQDNGVGFDMQHAQNLFGVFQRLHSAEAFEGTGIGLATVRRIVARHGGRTWAQAEVDKGATFFFALPVTTDCEDRCESTLCAGGKKCP